MHDSDTVGIYEVVHEASSAGDWLLESIYRGGEIPAIWVSRHLRAHVATDRAAAKW